MVRCWKQPSQYRKSEADWVEVNGRSPLFRYPFTGDIRQTTSIVDTKLLRSWENSNRMQLQRVTSSFILLANGICCSNGYRSGHLIKKFMKLT